LIFLEKKIAKGQQLFARFALLIKVRKRTATFCTLFSKKRKIECNSSIKPSIHIMSTKMSTLSTFASWSSKYETWADLKAWLQASEPTVEILEFDSPYVILKTAINPTAEEFHQIFAEWNKGELNSYLIDITEQIFTKKDEETGNPLVDVILDKAGQKGTGKWTVGNAVEHAVVLSTVNAAVEARILSSMKDKRVAASKILPTVEVKPFTGDRQQFINDVRDALYASKIVSYAQGLDLLATAGKFYNWNLNFGDIATIWRGGCIIRAAFLNRIKEAYEANPNLENLMLAPFFTEVFVKSQAGWRRAICAAVERGVAVPAFTASLGYYDSYRSARLPANLLQAQRDFFGAHTYERLDKPAGEFFHTNWTGQGGTTASTTYTA
jgi:6-phosphogluconate dehydrogenase